MTTAIQKKKVVWQKLIKCQQKQWTSGIWKEKYCKDCPYKKKCFELLGK